jgi:hypothetical protein
VRGTHTRKIGITIVEALTFSVEALGKRPIEYRPSNNIADMMRLIDQLVKQDATLSQTQEIAQRRLATLLAHNKQ